MTVKADLIAAKALIDTPKKFSIGASAAIDKVTGLKTAANFACVKAIREASSPEGTVWDNHDQVMARFDRAIAAQDDAS